MDKPVDGLGASQVLDSPSGENKVPVRIGAPLTLEMLEDVARDRRPVLFDEKAKARVAACRKVVEDILAKGDAAPNVYGVNTGFGALAETRISATDVRSLQRNLVRSHACGMGEPLTAAEVRGILVLRAQVLALGHSGVRPEVVELLCKMLDAGVVPRVPSRGSVGASGDLAPLAHVALAMIGEGDAGIWDGAATGCEPVYGPAKDALAKAGLQPIVLEAKEGLALINGTQMMASIGTLAVRDAERLSTAADIAGSMSLEALKGSSRPFDDRLQKLRPHPGQADCATNLRALLSGSEIAESHRDCKKVQDPYSLRCMPQIHGATRDALRFAREVLEREINAVTDNPLVFTTPDGEPELISGGNFHGQILAHALDLAGIATAELANVSERRVEQLVNPALSTGLTPFLAAKSGLESGFMIAQVASAALVSENKVLAHPASVDSIPSSAGKEDHVSMGSVSALKLRTIVANVRRALAIEIMTAAAGLDQRRPLRSSSGVEAALAKVREHVAPMTADRPLHGDIEIVATLVEQGDLTASVERAVGKLA